MALATTAAALFAPFMHLILDTRVPYPNNLGLAAWPERHYDYDYLMEDVTVFAFFPATSKETSQNSFRRQTD